MRIATITCQNANNHGARLQCYALVKYLQLQGHEVEVIDYRPDYMRGVAPLFYIPKSLKDFIKLFVYLPNRIIAGKRYEAFEAFSKKWIPRTKIYWSIDELRQDPPKADVYIAGSDQIWNTSFRNGTDPGYYLDFGPDDVRRESFAASFATEELVPSSVDFVKEHLRRFDKITVREQSALKILEKLGIQGELQDDPVFMLTKEQWDEVADGTGAGEKYVLVYDFYLGDDIKKKAQEIAKKVTDALGGYGIFGVEMFIKGDEVIFSEVSPRPHDTGMVTMISQDQSEFALHARALLGLPVPEIRFYGPSASRAVVVEGDTDTLNFENLDKVLEEPGTQMRIFGKPEVSGHRRMAVILATDVDVEAAKAKAERAYEKLQIEVCPREK